MTVRVVVTAGLASLVSGACGGTLEEEYRRNQRTPGSEPGTTAPGEASLSEGVVRFFRFGSASGEPAPPAPPAVPAGSPSAADPAPAPGDAAGPTAPAPGPLQEASSRSAAAGRTPAGAHGVSPPPPAPPPPPPPTEVGVTATIVRMGGAIPLSGPLGAVGRQELYGFDARVQRINDAGGIHGRRIKLIVHDDGLDPRRDRVLFRRLVETDQVFSAFAAGSVRSVADYACREVARTQGQPLPIVADVAALPERQVSPAHRCVFTTGPGTRHAAWIRAQKAKSLGASSIGMIMSDDPVWDEADPMAEEAETVYEEEGLVVKGRERMPVGAASCDDRVSETLRHNPDYLFLNLSTTEDLHRCISAMRRLAWRARVATEVALPADEVAAGAGSFAEGFLSTSVFLPPDDASVAMAEYRADLARYHPDADPASPVTLGAYVGAKVTEHLLAGTGPNLTRAAFLRAADGLSAWDSGLGPVLTWSPAQRVGTKKVAMLAATGGRFVPTGETAESACPETLCAP